MANVLPNSAVAKSTARLYLNEKFADVHFVFSVDGGTQKIPANKDILAALSSVFDDLFFESLPEPTDVEIVGASPEAFKEFLQFFYLDSVTLTIKNIEAVARLAEKYDILDCVNACAAFVESQLTMDKMCWGYQLAIFLKNQATIEFCEEKISESPLEIFASDEFLRCDDETLGRILRLNLSCSESDVFEACVEWGKNACKEDGLDATRLENVKAQLGENFKAIRFGDMSIGTFIKIHTSYKDLFTPDEFQDIILQITCTEYKSTLFKQSSWPFAWDNASVLECERINESNTARIVEGVEIVSFSSNQSVLLGAIHSFSTHDGSMYVSNGFETDVAIIQLQDVTSRSNLFAKELFIGAFNTWSNDQLKIILPDPILIKPQIVYEIRLVKIPSSYYYNATLKPKVMLDDGIQITFHQSASAGYDNVSTGWISTLMFNKA